MSRPRETTLIAAIREMEAALRFYRDSKWNHDYPGGIDNWPNDDGLDMGGRASQALRNPAVRRAVTFATPEPSR